METTIIIMCGGQGKRMNSDLPKVLHKINNIPMLCMIINQARKLKPKNIMIIVGKYKDIIKSTISKYTTLSDLEFIDQLIPLGTGHAIFCCKDYLINMNSRVLILSGDVPLITDTTMKIMVNDNNTKIIGTVINDPKGYGRIIMDDNFQCIVEDKDCDDDQKKVNLVNCGIYAISSELICKYIGEIKNNNKQNEYYLTDLIGIIKNNGHDVLVHTISKEQQYEITGVNDPQQLKELEILYNKLIKI